MEMPGPLEGSTTGAACSVARCAEASFIQLREAAGRGKSWA
jgi:hypothetical protein